VPGCALEPGRALSRGDNCFCNWPQNHKYSPPKKIGIFYAFSISAAFADRKSFATQEFNMSSRKIIAASCAALLLVLTGCETFAGAGRDVQKAGETIEEAAE